MTPTRGALGALIPLFAASAVQATEYHWHGASGLLPSAVTPGFTLVDSASPENPVLANGTLTLSGSTNSETMCYIITGNDIGLPELLQIDFRMRFVSGSSSVSAVAPAAVVVTTAASTGIALYFGPDLAFFNTGNDARGPSVSHIDTDGSFHDYSLVVHGRTSGSAVSLYQDGTFILGNRTDVNGSQNGALPRVAFGEFSIRAAGVSEWQSFDIATAAVPEPSAAWLLLVGLPLLIARARRAARG